MYINYMYSVMYIEYHIICNIWLHTHWHENANNIQYHRVYRYGMMWHEINYLFLFCLVYQYLQCNMSCVIWLEGLLFQLYGYQYHEYYVICGATEPDGCTDGCNMCMASLRLVITCVWRQFVLRNPLLRSYYLGGWRPSGLKLPRVRLVCA